MISFKRIKIKCPKCNKLICTAKQGASTQGIYFWCTRCKEEFEVKEEKKYRALEADNK